MVVMKERRMGRMVVLGPLRGSFDDSVYISSTLYLSLIASCED